MHGARSTVLYCTVLRAGLKIFPAARARTGEKVHKPSRILHALLKKTCKTGGCLLKISDQDLPPPAV